MPVSVPAYADTTTTINFDPPTFTEGQVLTTTSGVTFPDNPVVFKPTKTTTQSSPFAIRSQQDCGERPIGSFGLGCNGIATHQRMIFSNPVSTVSLRAGTEGPFGGCFTETYAVDCGLYGRLIGYDARGSVVADSGDIAILGDFTDSRPITVKIAITDNLARIKSATIFFGVNMLDPEHEGFPERVQIDDLSFTVPDQYSPYVIPDPPTITITSPSAGNSFDLHSIIYMKGSVNAPGGLSAFCTTLNVPFAPTFNQCRQKASVDSTGEFSVSFDANLNPNTNTLYAFAYDYSGHTTMSKIDISAKTPPAPVVTIWNSPYTQPNFPSPDHISGFVNSIAEISAFCTRQNDPAIPSINQCNQIGDLGFGNTFQILEANYDHKSGNNTFYAYAYDKWGQLGSAKLSLMLPIDIKITGMEVTQGIQTEQIQLNPPPILLHGVKISGPVEYSGVKLIAEGKTIVRVFVGVDGEGSFSTSPINVELWGTYPNHSQGESEVLGYLFPDNGPRRLSPDQSDITAQRRDPDGAFVFTLPHDWTRNSEITLTARITGLPQKIECPGCDDNNSFSVTKVHFYGQSLIYVHPVEIIWTNTAGKTIRPSSSYDVFSRIASISPIKENGLVVSPYRTVIDVTDLKNKLNTGLISWKNFQGQVFWRVANSDSNPIADYFIIGISSGLPIAGVEAGTVGPPPWPNLRPIAIADQMDNNTNVPRPLTQVAHEFYHELGYFHAGISCPNANMANNWPPDDRGDIQGIGLDRRYDPSLPVGTYRIIVPLPGIALPPSEWVDLMSYCIKDYIPSNGDFNAWISVRNWNSFGGPFPNGLFPDLLEPTIATIGSAPTNFHTGDSTTMRVDAIINETGGVNIMDVEHGDWKYGTNGTIPSPYRLTLYDQNEKIISNNYFVSLLGHIHGKSPSLITSLSAYVLADNATHLKIFHNDVMVAERFKSPNVPIVKIISPNTATYVNGSGQTLVKWKASDADGDSLESKVEYSVDDWKTSQILTNGFNGDQMLIPNQFFSGSGQAQLRVTVNDGFNEGTYTSEPFKVQGSLPVVRILEPVDGMKLRDDTLLRLDGQALDNTDKPLENQSLTWYIDGQLIGSGSAINEGTLPPGKHEVKLQATDSNGLISNTISVIEVLEDINTTGEPRFFTIGSVLDGKLYLINGTSINAKATSFTINSNKSIHIQLSGKDEVSLTLPKGLVDGIFKITDGVNELEFKNKETNASSTITFIVPVNTNSVEIFGTTAVPEFPLTLQVMLISIIGVIVFMRSRTFLL